MDHKCLTEGRISSLCFGQQVRSLEDAEPNSALWRAFPQIRERRLLFTDGVRRMKANAAAASRGADACRFGDSSARLERHSEPKGGGNRYPLSRSLLKMLRAGLR